MNITSDQIGAVTIPIAIVVVIVVIIGGAVKGCEVAQQAPLKQVELEGKANLLRIERGWVERVNPLTGKTEWHSMTNLPTVTIERK